MEKNILICNKLEFLSLQKRPCRPTARTWRPSSSVSATSWWAPGEDYPTRLCRRPESQIGSMLYPVKIKLICWFNVHVQQRSVYVEWRCITPICLFQLHIQSMKKEHRSTIQRLEKTIDNDKRDCEQQNEILEETRQELRDKTSRLTRMEKEIQDLRKERDESQAEVITPSHLPCTSSV